MTSRYHRHILKTKPKKPETALEAFAAAMLTIGTVTIGIVIMHIL